MRPFLTASACATGRLASIVRTVPLTKRRINRRSSAGGERGKRATAQRDDACVADACAETAIEADRTVVAVPHAPLDARQAAPRRFPGDRGYERTPDTVAA